jgi:hypothetical protein
MPCFSFSFFFSAKLGNRRVEQVLPRVEGWHQWEVGGGEERGQEGEYGAKKCVHMHVNAKMILVETIP